jgi:hypothetical protein
VTETFEKITFLESTRVAGEAVVTAEQDSPTVIEWLQQLSRNDLGACSTGMTGELSPVHLVPPVIRLGWIAQVWSGGMSTSCTTDSTGSCIVVASGISRSTAAITFTMTSVVADTALYAVAANHDADRDSDGTSITVRKR